MSERLVSTASSVTIPQTLESPTAKLCYTYLSATGPATVGELASALDLKRLELLPLLDTLSDDECVERDGDRYTLSE